MEKLIISVAVTGSMPTKQMNPSVPYSPKEIADSAVESWKAGAAIAHIHVRDPNTGKPSKDINLFREVVDRIRSKCDMLINLTTSWLQHRRDGRPGVNGKEGRAPATKARDMFPGYWINEFGL